MDFYILLMVFGIVIDKQNACQCINFYRFCDIFSLIDKQNACQPNIKWDWQAKCLSVTIYKQKACQWDKTRQDKTR